MRINRRLKTTFGKISKLYHISRVSYPKELVKDVIKLSQIGSDAKILDVGCGSGQATILFAKKGYSIIGLDISKDLISIAKKNFSKYSNAKFRKESFEKLSFPEESFNLIISGQAWHWIDPRIAYKKSYKLLRNNGYLAVFWSFQENEKSSFLQKTSKILDKYNPKFKPPMHYSEVAEKKMTSSKLFDNPIKKIYYTTQEFNHRKYLNLVLTYSWVQKLPETKRKNLTKELKGLLQQERSKIKTPYKYILLIARKKTKTPRNEQNN